MSDIMMLCLDCSTNANVKLNLEFDSYYCTKCNAWIEQKCEDSMCMYCSKRPDCPLSN